MIISRRNNISTGCLERILTLLCHVGPSSVAFLLRPARSMVVRPSGVANRGDWTKDAGCAPTLAREDRRRSLTTGASPAAPEHLAAKYLWQIHKPG
jgi:hypothetical protein